MTKVVPIEGCERCAPLIAELRAQNAELREQLTALSARLAQLEERARLNSTNSNQPPSSDGPGVQRPQKPPSGRKQGAQPGHPGKSRQMLPPERVDEVVERHPQRCEACKEPLGGDAEAYRVHQVTELPSLRAKVTEYRLYSTLCEGCGHRTEASLPDAVGQGAFGAKLQATVALLSGEYRLSKRKVEQAAEDLFDVPISLGSVVRLQQATSEVLREPVQEARDFVQKAGGAKHLDETGWKQGRGRKKAWLWVALSGSVAVFLVRLSRGGAVARELLGAFVRGIVVSDRFSAYNWLGLWQRQICWAHLLRDFKQAAERPGPSAALAEALWTASRAMLRQWKRVRDGTIERSTFQTYYAVRFRAQIHALLVQGPSCTDKPLAAVCRWLLKREQAMWSFVRYDGLEPTNNAAERALRHAVLWRRSSHGTQSPKGSVFVERMLTVVTTLRLQRRNVLEYLTDACQAALLGLPVPSLLPVPQHQHAPSLAAAG